MFFSEEEDLIWGCRVSWIQGICDFFDLLNCFKSLFLWDRKTIRLRSSLDGPQARKIRVYLPWKSRSRAFSLPTNVVVAGDGMQWGFTCLWDLVQLLQHLCLQESLILGCGLFQLRLEIFRPRGVRQLGNSLAMSAIETEPTSQLDNPAWLYSCTWAWISFSSAFKIC